MRYAFLPLLLLAACKAEVAPPAEPVATPDVATPVASAAAVFFCADSTEIFALFGEDSTGTSTVALAIGDERIRMRQVEAASGAKYADSAATATLWNKGEEVLFDRGGTSVSCQSRSSAATAPSAAHGATQ